MRSWKAKNTSQNIMMVVCTLGLRSLPLNDDPFQFRGQSVGLPHFFLWGIVMACSKCGDQMSI